MPSGGMCGGSRESAFDCMFITLPGIFVLKRMQRKWALESAEVLFGREAARLEEYPGAPPLEIL